MKINRVTECRSEDEILSTYPIMRQLKAALKSRAIFKSGS